MNNYAEARKVVASFSDDVAALNETVFINYCQSANYFDDFMDKTAFYLDMAS